MAIKIINPQLLDLVMRNKDYIIYYGDAPLKTPEGNDFIASNPRILQHILIELSLAEKISYDTINAYVIFSLITDYLMKGSDELAESIDEVIKNDSFVKFKTGEKNGTQRINVDSFMEFLDENDQLLNFIFYGVSSIQKSLNLFLIESSKNKINYNSPKEFYKHIKECYLGLSVAQRAIVEILCTTHDSGIILPLLLVLGRINPSEYTNALFAVRMNYLQHKDNRKTFFEIVNPPIKCKLIVPDWKNPLKSFNEIHNKVLKLIEYLSYFSHDEKTVGIQELIDTGEGYNLEFKTSFRWDIRAGKKNPAIEHASLKTIAAFLNSGGGNLLIGVEDDGKIQGIEIDRFDNEDKFLLHLWNMIKSSMGQDVTSNIQTILKKLDEKTVCNVKCLRSPSPVFLKQKGFDEEFYIRIGPSSASLEIREALKYISERFGV